MSNRILVAGMASLGLGWLAFATPAAAAMSAHAFMKAVNTNADVDKTISKTEIDDYAKKRFADLEKDNDKTLDDKELKGRLSAAGMTMADTDKDKTVDESEFVGYADKLFDEANTNKTKDNTISIRELKNPAGQKLIKLLQ